MATYTTPQALIDAILRIGEEEYSFDEPRTWPTSTGKTRPAVELIRTLTESRPFDSVLGNPPFTGTPPTQA